MESKLLESLNKTTDIRNYLKKAQDNSHSYLKNFEKVYEVYLNNFPNDVKNWLRDKMQLNSNSFNEKQFIQFACEATIVAYFTCKFPSNAKIEKKVNPNNRKDVDLVFTHNNYTFNIEVKCSDYVEKERINNNNSLKVQTIGRLTGLEETISQLTPALNQIVYELNLSDGVEIAKNMDNNLKDFLKSADEKFNPESSNQELNILAVSCDDAEDMQLWYYYLYKDAGLFTSNSFYPTLNFENVDLVLLNNLYFRHNKYKTKNISNSWNLLDAFCLIFKNPFAKKIKECAIQEFLMLCPNYNNMFKDWDSGSSVEEEVKDIRKIADFIKLELEENQKLYLFEKPELDLK